MALVSVRIGSMANIHVFEDADYDSAIETTAPIKAGPPVDGNDVVRLDDLPFLVAFVSHIVNHVLTLADLRKVHLFNSALNLICTLPSVDATNVGDWVVIAKQGAGNLTVVAADADTILDSTPGGVIECTDNTYEMPRVGLRLYTADEWHSGPECFGVWSTR